MKLSNIGFRLYDVGLWILSAIELGNVVINFRWGKTWLRYYFIHDVHNFLRFIRYRIKSLSKMKQILQCNRLQCHVCYYFYRVTEKIILIIFTTIYSQYAGFNAIFATFLTTLFYTWHTAMTFYLEVTFFLTNWTAISLSFTL